jgi:type IV pilus assembly protein PilE
MIAWSRRRALGFSLIELMVTVAIAGILAAIAYPSYTQYVMRSRRSDAKTALLDLAARQERLFSMQNQYSNSPTALGYSTAFPVQILSSGQAYYQLRVTLTNATTYTAFADPINAQATDTACGTFSITNLGVQSVTGTQTAASCW